MYIILYAAIVFFETPNHENTFTQLLIATGGWFEPLHSHCSSLIISRHLHNSAFEVTPLEYDWLMFIMQWQGTRMERAMKGFAYALSLDYF